MKWALACVWAFAVVLGAQQPPVSDGPRYVSDAELARPTNYREWVFLSSGLGMGYNEPTPGGPPASTAFTNTFVNPSAYRAFMQTGRWPDKTVLILESRASSGEGSITRTGRFQTRVTSLEVEVKDVAKYPPTGWAFFFFGAGDKARERAAPLPRSFDCYACHAKHTAVDNTFVQFYPTLLDVAREKGTLNKGF
jgi:hypothetical protein